MHRSRGSDRRVSIYAVLLFGLAVTACGKCDDDNDDPDGGGNDGGGQVVAISVHGTVTYDYVPATTAGGVTLAFDEASVKPVRGAIVQARRGNTIVATTNTNETGAYTLAFDADPTNLVVAVLTETTTPAITVEDNTDGDAVWGMVRALADAENETLDLHATHGWTGTGFDADTRVAAPFAILDTMYTVAEAFRAVRTVNFPALNVNWSPDNVPQSGDKTDGLIGTSHYDPEDGEIYVLGKDGVDTDEFDSHVIGHEWTHYFEDQLARSDSPGGAHSGGDVLDPRLAFGEGLGNAIAGMTLADPVYVDTVWGGGGALGGFFIDSETQPMPTDDTAPGPFSELSVNRILYDLFDTGATEAHDTIALGLGPIYDVLTGSQRTTDALTTIGSFITGIKAQAGVSATDVNTLLAFYDVGAITGIYGAGDTDLAAMYTNITIPFTSTHALTGGQGPNWRQQNQYFVFTGTGAELTVSAGHVSEDVGIALYRAGEVVGEADQFFLGTESFDVTTVAGATYVLVLTGFRETAGAYTVNLAITP